MGSKKQLTQPVKMQNLKPQRKSRIILCLIKLDTSGSDSWDPKEKQAAHGLREFMDLFAKHIHDLGRNSLVKHEFKLKPDTKPFKEWYYKILPGVYDEVRAHLKEMLEIRAICPSLSPWASAVILIHKKDSKLHFCIDLCKLNELTIKDAYSILQIKDTLDCLKGTIWFTSLGLKSRYWQVEMCEASKALTTFTVGLLDFMSVSTCHLA